MVPGNRNFANPLHISAPRQNGNRQKLQAFMCFYEIAIPPISLRELDVIQEHERVDRINEIKVPLPREIIRLYDPYDLPQLRTYVLDALRGRYSVGTVAAPLKKLLGGASARTSAPAPTSERSPTATPSRSVALTPMKQ